MLDGKPSRLLLVDDHALVRSGVRRLLEAHPGFEVVAEAAHGKEALDLLADRPVDLVVMDISMPVQDGLETTAALRERAPGIPVVMLTMHATEPYLKRALEAGARGFCVKTAPSAELTGAIQQVIRGERYVSARIPVVDGSPDRLTRRQLQTLELIALSFTTKEIAKELGISVKTVESHRTALMRQLDLHDLAGLVRYAIRMGVVTPFAQRPRVA